MEKRENIRVHATSSAAKKKKKSIDNGSTVTGPTFLLYHKENNWISLMQKILNSFEFWKCDFAFFFFVCWWD